MSSINLQSLPSDIDLNNLSFPDDRWYNFSNEQRNAINALRNLRNNGRQDNDASDELNSLGNSAARGDGNNRHIYQLTHMPPAPTGDPINPPAQLPNGNATATRTAPSINSNNAESAFSRRGS